MPTTVSDAASGYPRPGTSAIIRAATAALRNRRLGLWAACMMERNPMAADAYADEIVMLGLQRGGDKAIIDRIVADFARCGVPVTPETLCLEAARFAPRSDVRPDRPVPVAAAA